MNNSYFGSYPYSYPNFYMNQDPYFVNGFPYQHLPPSFAAPYGFGEQTPQQAVVKEQNSYVTDEQKMVDRQSFKIEEKPKRKYTLTKKRVRLPKVQKDTTYIPKKQKIVVHHINERYISKNIQSNIVNQIYAFLWNQQKSGNYLREYLKKQKGKAIIFYQNFKIIRRSTKRYVTKDFLANLCDYHQGHLAYTKVIKNPKKIEYFPIHQFTACIKYLIKIYLMKLCPKSIITSKKMRKQIWIKHLKKCRFVRRFLFFGQKDEEQNLEQQRDSQEELVKNNQQENFSENFLKQQDQSD